MAFFLHDILLLSSWHPSHISFIIECFCEMSPNMKHRRWKMVQLPSSRSLPLQGEAIAPLLMLGFSSQSASVVPSLPLESAMKAWSLNGAALFTSAHTVLLYQAQLCVSFLERFTMKAGLLPPLCIIAPRNFRAVGGCVSGSLLSAQLSIQGLLCSTEVVGGCAKMARELKWNSQILPPTCRSRIKTPVLFSLAMCLLHVSVIVKLCVICCDSFIILESTDVALLFLYNRDRTAFSCFR